MSIGKNFKYKGFTLIELLVVITIIAILSTLGLVLFGNVQSRARDSQRRGDINAIAKAMEANYNFISSVLFIVNEPIQIGLDNTT